MNSLYTLVLRQSTSIASDLDLFESQIRSRSSSSANGDAAVAISINGAGPSLNKTGQDLVQVKRTLGDYEKMAQNEMVETKKVKATQRARQLRGEIDGLSERHKNLKTYEASAKSESDLSTFLSTLSSSALPHSTSSTLSPSSSSTHLTPTAHSTSTSSPYSNPNQQLHSRNYSATPGASTSSSYPPPPRPYSNSTSNYGNPYASAQGYDGRTTAALDEHSFLKNTGTVLDDYIAQGKAVLDNLGNQRDIMKGTQRRLLSAANTLGLSRETIHFIEKRTKADFALLIAGATATIILMIVIIRYLG